MLKHELCYTCHLFITTTIKQLQFLLFSLKLVCLQFYHTTTLNLHFISENCKIYEYNFKYDRFPLEANSASISVEKSSISKLTAESS